MIGRINRNRMKFWALGCFVGFCLCFSLIKLLKETRWSATTAKMNHVQLFNGDALPVKDTSNTPSNSEHKINEQENQIESRFKTRKEYLRQKCDLLNPPFGKTSCSLQRLTENVMVVNGADVSVCLIQKSGSTFLERILHLAGGEGGDVYSVNSSFVRSNKKSGYKKLSQKQASMADKIKMAEQLTSVLFVRDPYTRAFSGWYDKFYSPHAHYWKSIGRKIVKSERPGATKHSLQCGCDVTFPEFISYLSRKLGDEDTCLMDLHFASGYDHCFPCDLSYNYIGKYETLKEDTHYLIQHLNFSRRVVLPDEHSSFSFREFYDGTRFVFGSKMDIVKSVSFRCALFRLWRRFQGRGMIDAQIPFPVVSNEQAEKLTMDEFTQLLIKAYSNSNHATLKANRQDALAQAFSFLSQDYLQKFQTAFTFDFELFGYSKTAPIAASNSVVNFLEKCPQ